MTVTNLGRQHPRFLDSYFKSSWEYMYLFGILLVIISYNIYFLNSLYIILSSYHSWFCIPSIMQQLYAICHINEKTTPR